MGCILQDLPTELLQLILRHLPISSLLAFATTSKSNHRLSIEVFTVLDLAIFPRRIHSLLAFLDHGSNLDDRDGSDDEDEHFKNNLSIPKYWSYGSVGDKNLYQIGLTTPPSTRPSPSRSSTPPLQLTGAQRKALHRELPSSFLHPTVQSLRAAEIANQNTLATIALSSPSLCNLRALTLRLYEINSTDLTHRMANLSTLTSLTLDFFHPYIHDSTLPARYWRESVPNGSPVWNNLAGVGMQQRTALRLRGLRCLRIGRCGITSFQLRHWVEANPELRELRLSLCRGVDRNFVDWLAQYMVLPDRARRGKLETVRLISCPLLQIKTESDFDLVRTLARSGSIRELNLRDCRSVDEERFLSLATNRTGHGANWTFFEATEDLWVSNAGHTGLQKLVSPGGVIVRRSGDPGGLPSVQTVRSESPSHGSLVNNGNSDYGSSVGSNGSSTDTADRRAYQGSGNYFGTIEVDTEMGL